MKQVFSFAQPSRGHAWGNKHEMQEGKRGRGLQEGYSNEQGQTGRGSEGGLLKSR